MQNILLYLATFTTLAFIIVFVHVFIYKLFILFFEITSKKIKSIIKYYLIFSPFIYIGSSIYVRSYTNPLVVFIYYLSGLWLGVLTMLAIFLLLYFFIYSLIRFFYKDFNPISIGKYVFYFAILISIFGVYHAKDIQVKNISITSNKIPVFWNNKKIVQVSDVHLGTFFDEDFLKKIVVKINEQNPDLVVITGDLFDGVTLDFSYLLSNLPQINSKNGVYFVNGNHDGYFGVEKADDLLTKSNVKVMKDEVSDIDGLQIVGIDYLKNINIKDQIKKIVKYDENKYNVLLYHEPIQILENKDAGIDFQLAGHTHNGQIFPFGLVTKLIYGKYAYGLNKIDEFYSYTTSGVGLWGPDMRIGTDSEIVVFTLNSGKN